MGITTVFRSSRETERNVRLFKDVVLFLAAVITAGLILAFCFYTMLKTTSSADDKKWAMLVLTGASGGLLGYLIGK
ncbi:MAG: hypothetical protein V3V22_11085 [Methylococcales bacterium]